MSGYTWNGKRPAPETAFCLCGCGEPAPVARKTDRRYGAVKGKPRRYLVGHAPGTGGAPRPAAPDAPPCGCGCGQGVALATRTNRARGYVKGQPYRYVSGHHQRPGDAA